MKLLLSVSERIALQTALLERDSFENLCLRKEVLDKTSFTSEEIESNKIKTIQEQNGSSRLSWIDTEEREFDFNAVSVAYIQGNLKRLSDARELSLIQFPLYKKFHEL